MDLPFLMLVLLLTGIGVIMVFSASYATAYLQEDKSPTFYFFRQALFAAAGLTVMYITSKINYQTFRWLSVFALGLAVLLLIAVLIPGIHTSRSDGVKRWIAVPGIGTFQPSEIAKVAVIMYFSARLSKRNTEKPRRLSPRSPLSGVVGFLDRIGFLELVPYGLILLLIVGLMMLEPHMSGTILILAGAAAVLFAAGIKLYWFAGGGAFDGAGGAHDERLPVTASWVAGSWAYPRDGGYQIIQSLYAIGSGGLLGLGLGKSRQKFLYLPEPENDFIFAIVCEELGLIGAGIVLILFALLVMQGYWIAIHARRPLRRPSGGGYHHPDRSTGVPEHLRGHQPDPYHRHLPAVFQLRGYGADDPTGGDGHHPFRFPADPGAETGVKRSREDAVPLRGQGQWCAPQAHVLLRTSSANFFHPMAGEAF